jgi:hypothetical protein
MPSITLPTATLVAGGLAAAGGVASSVIGANAAQDAANTQLTAAQQAAARLQPFTQVGQGAIPEIQGLLGLPDANGNLPSSDQINTFLQGTPGYQFTMQQGLESVQNGFAAQGLARSGAAMKGAEGFASGLASQQYQNILGNYTNLLANSQSAAAGQGGALIGGANAAAAGQIGVANAISSGLSGTANTAGNTAINYAALSALQGGGANGLSPVGVTGLNSSFLPGGSAFNTALPTSAASDLAFIP